MQYQYIKVGQKREEWRGFPEGFLMSYDEYSGMTLYFFLDRPSEAMLREVRHGGAFEIALADIEKVGFFTIRFGALPVGDCAFDPSLYRSARLPEPPGPGEGLVLSVVVVDSAEGPVEYLRKIALGHDFSVKLVNWLHNRSRAGVAPEEFRSIIGRTYNTYGTAQLLEMANIRWSNADGARA